MIGMREMTLQEFQHLPRLTRRGAPPFPPACKECRRQTPDSRREYRRPPRAGPRSHLCGQRCRLGRTRYSSMHPTIAAGVQFLREFLSVNLISTTAAPLAQSAARGGGGGPIVAVLSIVLAIILNGRPAPTTLGGAVLAAPAGRTAEAVTLLLTAAAAGSALKGVRSIKNWLKNRPNFSSKNH